MNRGAIAGLTGSLFVAIGLFGCGGDDTLHWSFKQPEAEIKRVVDLLFVIDTSPSMDKERRKIADHIPEDHGSGRWTEVDIQF